MTKHATDSLKIIGGATSRTMRAHWAAHELGLDYDVELIGSRTGATQAPEFIALNVKEKIPVLLHNKLVLTESGAIINHLSRVAEAQRGKVGSGEGLLPAHADLHACAKYDEWMSYLLMEIDAQSLYILRKHDDLTHIYGEAPAAVATARKCFETHIQVAERALMQTDYLLGSTFSGVDIVLTTCLDWAKTCRFELSEVFNTYLKRVHARPACKTAGRLNFSISAGA